MKEFLEGDRHCRVRAPEEVREAENTVKICGKGLAGNWFGSTSGTCERLGHEVTEYREKAKQNWKRVKTRNRWKYRAGSSNTTRCQVTLRSTNHRYQPSHVEAGSITEM